MADDGELLGYACGRFEDGCYDEALEAFVLAYSKGIEREWVLENIYSCYLAPNEAEFQAAYGSTIGGGLLPYGDCVLDFYPYQDGCYFIFDRELELFRGKFTVAELEDAQIPVFMEEYPFSDMALALDWDWRRALGILRCAKERRVYVVCPDLPRVLSFCKVPELAGYLENVRFFRDYGEFQDYFHQNPGVYLPRILGGLPGEKEQFDKIVDAEHAYRLTPEGRCADHVLLTIGIPTYNRGNLLLKRLEHLRRMPFDAEVEIAVSKNGTMLYQEEYRQAAALPDARINYCDQGGDMWAGENWQSVVEMSHGKYVLFVSDEDDVVLEHLEHYLALLAEFPDASVIRSSGTKFYNTTQSRVYQKAGPEAFEASFLRQNYLSGLIVDRERFLSAHLRELSKYSENEYYRRYPHDWWCAKLTQVGDYIEEPVRLISEQDNVLKEEVAYYQEHGTLGEGDGFSPDMKLGHYAMYEERIKQFHGELEFLRAEFPQNAREYWINGLIRAIGKLLYLMEMARGRHHEPDQYLGKIDEAAALSIEAVQSAPLTDEDKEYILINLKKWVSESIELDRKMREEEAGHEAV